MVTRRRLLGFGAAMLLAWSGVSAVPAQAADDGYTSWTAHSSAADPANDATDFFAAGSVHVREFPEGITVWTDPVDGHAALLAMSTVGGGPFKAGTTYTSPELQRGDASTEGARLAVYRDDRACGTDDYFGASPGRWHVGSPRPASFTVQELEHDSAGALTRFRATYELNCQRLGGPRGAEGSVAFNATAPAEAVPTVVTPGPVTGFHATNVGPDGADETSTTLSWTRPPGAGDVVVDVKGSKDPLNLSADVGGNQAYAGRADTWTDPQIDTMVTRTYRVTPRGPGGRLGEPRTLTVMGTRWSALENTDHVQVGEEATFSGRLLEALDYGDISAIDEAPGLGGLRIDLCLNSSPWRGDVCDLVASSTTTANGFYTFSVRPMENSVYDVRVLAGPANLANVARVANAAFVSPQTDLSAPEGEVATVRAGVVRRGSIVHFSTSRSRVGSSGTVRLQRLDGRTWRTLVTKRLVNRGPSRMRMPYRERKAGSHSYRVVKSPDSRHVTGYSRVVRVRVR